MNIGIGLDLSRFRVPAVYDVAAVNLFARMTSQPDAARKAVINQFIIGLKSSGAWAKSDVIYATAAHDSQAALLDWKNLGGAEAFNATVVGVPTFAADRGYTNNSNTGYLSTGYAPATNGVKLALNSAHLAAWSRTSGANAGGTHETGIQANLTTTCRSSTNTALYRVNDGTNATVASSTDGSGFFMASRSASNARRLFRNGAQIGATSTTASTATSATAAKIGGVNTGVNREWAFQSMGADLNVEAAAFYAAVAAYMTAVGAA